jgi:hypothetical protein
VAVDLEGRVKAEQEGEQRKKRTETETRHDPCLAAKLDKVLFSFPDFHSTFTHSPP